MFTPGDSCPNQESCDYFTIAYDLITSSLKLLTTKFFQYLLHVAVNGSVV